MEELPKQRTIALYALVFILGGIILYGFFEHKKSIATLETIRAELASTTASYETRLSQKETVLLEKELENASLLESLAQEQKKNGSFEGQLRSMSSTVSTLKKLSETDPQLLAKYSKIYFLNENYAPRSRSSIPSEYGYQTDRVYEFHSEALPFLTALLEAAKKDAVPLLIASSYRSFNSQKSLKSIYTVRYGTTAANTFSADQGYSEHQLGTAVDFTTKELGGSFSGFDKTEAFAWLQENAHRYGFVLSYPKNNAYYVYEPWHWRFVGTSLAKDLKKDEKEFYALDQREINTYLITLFEK